MTQCYTASLAEKWLVMGGQQNPEQPCSPSQVRELTSVMKGGRWKLLQGKFFTGRSDNQDSLFPININLDYFWQKVLASHFFFSSPSFSFLFNFFFKLTILKKGKPCSYWTSCHAVAPLRQWDAVCSHGLTAASVRHGATYSNRSLGVAKMVLLNSLTGIWKQILPFVFIELPQ